MAGVAHSVLLAALLAAPPGSAQTPAPKAPPNLPTPVIVKGITGLRLKQPRLVSFRVTQGPFLNFILADGQRTVFEAELADFDPNVDGSDTPLLRSQDCGFAHHPIAEPGGNPYRVRWDRTFVGTDSSGRRCTLEINPYNGRTPPIPAGEIRLPTIETYTISNTWDLLSFTTPSGKKLSASATKGPILPCELASVGTAGTFATGVVKDGGDLSFQLRNGLVIETCTFEMRFGLEVIRPEFFVNKVEWQFTSDSLCRAQRQVGIVPGTGATDSAFFKNWAIFGARFEAECMFDERDRLKNSHLYKARLAKVEILGPSGRRWQDAFK